MFSNLDNYLRSHNVPGAAVGGVVPARFNRLKPSTGIFGGKISKRTTISVLLGVELFGTYQLLF